MTALVAARAALAATATAIFEVVIGGLTDIEDLTAEAEMHACQVVVEVHLHVLVTDLTDDTHDGTTVGGLHHQLGAFLYHLMHHIVFHEHRFVEVHHIALVAHAITLFGSQVEAIVVARLLAHQVLLELGQHLLHAADEGKGILFGGLLDDAAVLVFFAQDVGHCHDGLILNFH